MVFILPIVQLALLTFAATREIENIDLYAGDHDNSSASRQLLQKFDASEYFTLKKITYSQEEAFAAIAEEEAKLMIRIPRDFEKDLLNMQGAKVQMEINAVDGSQAGLIRSYSQSIIMDFNKQIISGVIVNPATGAGPAFDIRQRFWYNADLDYKKYMAPGILVILVTFTGMFLAGMNLVKEKEIGTIEQLNVSPIRKHHFIIGKLLPFWLTGNFILSLGLLTAWLLFDIPIRGNLLLLFGLTAVYLLVVLAAALLISTVTETQQQAMFISWFFVVVFILMSGIFTPIDSMPEWAQKIAFFNPIAHFGVIMRRVLLKGSGFSDVMTQFWFLLSFGVAMVTLAVWRYRKVS